MSRIDKMPKLSPTMEDGVIVKWHKAEGDEVKDGELLFEVQTDKATIDYNALDGGFLRKVLVKEGATAKVNQPVAIFTDTADEAFEEPGAEETAKEEEPTDANGEEGAKKEEKAPEKSAATMAEPEFAPPPPLENYELKIGKNRAILASPLAKKLASENGIDLSSVRGTGPNGRIISHDLEGKKGVKYSAFSEKPLPKDQPGTFESLELSPMRKTIAKRLQNSKTFIPHFYVQQKVRCESMVSLRQQLIDGGCKLTFNDFVVKAVATALEKMPQMNQGFNSKTQTITQYKTVDISLAVSIPDGLITPILFHANYKSIVQLSDEVKSLAKKAKEGALKPQEYQGGSFTISNLGMFGVLDFQAIVNPPQAGILSVGAILDEPVVEDGTVKAGKVLNLSLSVDHRVIDGALAAQFISEVKYLLEHPVILIS